jgi:hypothetical protein
MSQAETNVLPFAAKRKRPERRTGDPVRPTFEPLQLPPFKWTNIQWADSNLPIIRIAWAMCGKTVSELEDGARALRSPREQEIIGLLDEVLLLLFGTSPLHLNEQPLDQLVRQVIQCQ